MMKHFLIERRYSCCVVSPAKTAELIEMLFILWTQVGPRKHVLDGGPDPLGKGQFFRGKNMSGMPDDALP